MNIDKYRVQVSFISKLPADAGQLSSEDIKIYQDAVVGTLTELFPGEAVHVIPQFDDHPGIQEAAYEVVFANRRTHWLGDCERIVRQLRKSDSTFFVRVEALMFHDSPVEDRSAWLILGTAKYYANEGVTTETLLPSNVIATLLSYAPDGQDALYASNVVHEVIRNNLPLFNKLDSIYHIYRYGERHEIKL